MKATTSRGAPATLPATGSAKKKRKKKAPAPHGFMCDCGGTRSVFDGADEERRFHGGGSHGEPASAAKTTTTKCCCRDADDPSADGTPSVDSLLRQLRELEQGVRALDCGERAERKLRGAVDSECLEVVAEWTVGLRASDLRQWRTAE